MFQIITSRDGEEEEVWEQAREDVGGGAGPLPGAAATGRGGTEEEEGRCPNAVP